MSTFHLPRSSHRAAGVADVVRAAFWILALGLIACYAFFAALGAFSPAEVAGVTIAVGVLVLLWLGHAWHQHRAGGERDPRVRHARERRGF